MSVVGRKVGVISIGMSCQSGAQIKYHAPLLSRLTRDDALKISTMPFDNIICPPDSASSMLRGDIFYPDNPDDLAESSGAHWRDFGVYFWHEYRPHKHNVIEYLTGRLNTRRAYRKLIEKYERKSVNFRQARSIDRLVFVICNSQNNLSSAETGIDPKLSAASIESLCDACDAYVGKPCEYLLATYESRLSGEVCRDRLKVFQLTPDTSDWEGDRDQWRDVFERYFSHNLTS
jgi:hypothetical protein